MAFFSRLFKNDTSIQLQEVLLENYRQNVIYSPLVGILIPLETVSDPVFAQGTMGKGVAIQPSRGKLYAPVNGKVAALFPTKHAMGIVSDTGVEILIHIGIDTVELNGQGFKTYVEVGDTIKAGQLLIDFDIDYIVSKDLETTTMILISNYQSQHSMEIVKYGSVEVMEELILLQPAFQ